MKASTALFASVVAICCTINLVTGQIHFADGTSQSTAYTGQSGENGYYIPGDAAFSVYIEASMGGIFDVSGTVPIDQELVILQCTIHGRSGQKAHLYTVAGMDSIKLTQAQAGDTSGGTGNVFYPWHATFNYIDGTLLVDEGRYLEVNTSAAVTILGYYRDKEPPIV